MELAQPPSDDGGILGCLYHPAPQRRAKLSHLYPLWHFALEFLQPLSDGWDDFDYREQPPYQESLLPRELLPIANMLGHLVNFGIAFIVLVALLFISGIGLTRFAIWVPAILVTQILFVMGLAFFTSALHVHYRDVMMILDVGILAWFFLTPVFYPFEFISQSTQTIFGFSAATIMRWFNPMASIIDGYRTVLWGTIAGTGPSSMDPAFFVRTFVTALIVFVLGYIFFRRNQHTFGERL